MRKYIIRWESGFNPAFRAYLTDGVPLYMGESTEQELRAKIASFWPDAEVIRDDNAFSLEAK